MPNSFANTFGRVSLFIIYFGFGLLKILGLSPANPLVQSLQVKVLPFLSFQQFILIFAIFEMVIGILFLFRRFTGLASILFFIHMFATVLPLFMLPAITWQKTFVPTLEGQYIIKNLALISLVLFLRRNRR